MRKNANDAAGSPPEIRDLLLNQQLYLINDFPVVVVDSKYDNQRFALVVNPTTGFWETDQRFLEIVDNPGDFLVDRFVSGYDIAIRAQAIAESAELRQQLVP